MDIVLSKNVVKWAVFKISEVQSTFIVILKLKGKKDNTIKMFRSRTVEEANIKLNSERKHRYIYYIQ